MPINEYKCGTCKHVFDYWDTSFKYVQKYRVCPECGQDAKKQMTPSNFKVNGFNEANGYAGSK